MFVSARYPAVADLGNLSLRVTSWCQGYPTGVVNSVTLDRRASKSTIPVMNKRSKVLVRVDPAVTQALVLVCERCGRRSAEDGNPSHRLASQLKRQAKKTLERSQIRAVLTSCMKICPEDGIAVTIVPVCKTASVSSHWVADADNIDAACIALLQHCSLAFGQ